MGGLIESLWLAVLMVVPLLFNPHASAQYEPTKAVFIQVLALLALGAVCVHACESGQFEINSVLVRLKQPGGSLGALALLGCSWLISTAFSVRPGVSFWGSLEHGQGAFTFACEIVFLATVAVYLQTVEQVNRIVTAILAVSFPVSIYALIQVAGYEPLSVIYSDRASSFSGHPIFLGAYLALVMPLTVWRIWQAARPSPGAWRWIIAGFYTLLFLLQGAAFLFAQSRGPLLGLGATSLFLAIGWGMLKNRWRWAAGAGALAGFSVFFLVLLNRPAGPFTALAARPEWQRLAQVFPRRDGPQDARVEFWNQAPRVLFSQDSLPFPAGGTDGFHGLRALVGYGPDTLQNVLPHFYTVPNPTIKIENRFHNRMWDIWFSLGLFGVASFHAFFLLLFFEAYKRLEWMPTKRAKIFFWLLVLGCGGVGVALLAAWGGLGFVGLGWIGGLAAGLAVFPVLFRILFVPAAAVPEISPEGSFLVIVLLGAVMGHLVETGFAFSVAGTSLQVWIYAGMILALVRSPGIFPSIDGSSPVLRKGAVALSGPASNPIGVPSFAATLVLVTLLFGFIQVYSSEPLHAGEILSRTLTQISGTQKPSYLVAMLMIPTWLAVTFAFTAMSGAGRGLGRFARSWILSLIVSGGAAVAFALCNAWQAVSTGPIPPPRSSSSLILNQFHGYEEIYLVFIGVILGVVLCGAFFISPRTMNYTRRSGVKIGLAFLVLAVAFGTSWWGGLRRARADMAMRWGGALLTFQRGDAGITVYREGVRLDPRSLPVRRSLAEALMQMPESNVQRMTINERFREAEDNLLEAERISRGLDECSYELGRLYLRWAALEEESKRDLGLKAASGLDKALIFQPGSERTWVDRFLVDRLYLNQPAEAERKLAQADLLVRNQSGVVWGDVYRDRSLTTAGPKLQEQYARRAIGYYQRGANDSKGNPGEVARCLVQQGAVYFFSLHDPKSAETVLLKATAMGTSGEIWLAEMILAQISALKGDLSSARLHGGRSLEEAPPDKKPLLQELMRNFDQSGGRPGFRR